MTDNDIAAAMLIATAIILIGLCVWPGFARVKIDDIAGFWASPARGTFHEIEPADDSTFSRKVLASFPTPDGEQQVEGHLVGLRSIRIGGQKGLVEIGERQIRWKNGDLWVFQGIRD